MKLLRPALAVARRRLRRVRLRGQRIPCRHGRRTWRAPCAQASLPATLPPHWVACVPTRARVRGLTAFRCNVNFGDPHVEAYCAVLDRNRLSYLPWRHPTRVDRTAWPRRSRARGACQSAAARRTAESASTRARTRAASSPSADANCAAPSSVWKAQPPSRPIPISAAGHALRDVAEVGGEGQRRRVARRSRGRAARNASATAAVTAGSGRTPATTLPSSQAACGSACARRPHARRARARRHPRRGTSPAARARSPLRRRRRRGAARA